jgi:LmbE family N-acetylglucosaminyl deacetylase
MPWKRSGITARCKDVAPDTLIAARPHFRRDGNQLYFFLSERPFHTLTPDEAATWGKLERGAKPVRDLGDSAAVERLVQAGLVEQITPPDLGHRRRILVIEPHSDDAALSVGATMWKMRNEVEFHLLTMASRSNYTTAFQLHRNYFDRAAITAMRTAEGNLFARHLGGHYHCADLAEATLRYNDSDWDLRFYNSHQVPIAISNNRRAPRAVLDKWIERLAEFLQGKVFDEIWVPLGAGTHSDHDLTRNAALELIPKEHPDVLVRLYEDVPYGAEFQEHTQRILTALTEAGAALTPWSQDVTAEFPAKLSLLKIFASQFKVPSIQAGVERSAGGPTASTKRESLWTLERLPHQLPEEEMWVGAPGVKRAAADLPRFLKGARATRRVALFAISAAGRWAEDLSLLREKFPAARLVVYANPRVCAEFGEAERTGVEFHCLDGRPISWFKAALREITTGHRIVVAGDAVRNAKSLMVLWPTGRKIACTEMDHLIQALRVSPSDRSSSLN